MSIWRLAASTILNSRKCMALHNVTKDQKIPETLSLCSPVKLENESDVHSRSEFFCKEDVVAVAFCFWTEV